MRKPYGITVVAPPVLEPLQVDRVRNHLRLTQTADDTEIRDVWIPAARRLVEADLGICLITQTIGVGLTRFPGVVPFDELHPEEVGHSVSVDLPVAPVQSVSSITYYDFDDNLQTLDPSIYELDSTRPVATVRPVFNAVWPMVYPRQVAATINVVAGYGTDGSTVPAGIIAAMLIMIRDWYDGVDEGEMHPRARALLDLEWPGGSYDGSQR